MLLNSLAMSSSSRGKPAIDTRLLSDCAPIDAASRLNRRSGASPVRAIRPAPVATMISRSGKASTVALMNPASSVPSRWRSADRKNRTSAPSATLATPCMPL